MDHSIGHVRNSFDTSRAWDQLREDRSIPHDEPDLGDSLYTDEEMELNKAILAGFLRQLAPPIENEINSHNSV